MEQPLNPVSAPPQSFESRLSRGRAWTLVPTFYGPILVWAIVKYGLIRQGLEVSAYVSL